MSAKTGASSALDWLLPPRTVRLNRDTGLLKLIAMLAMLTDHLGAAFFPQYRAMRVIGRIAFPIYAYCLAVGCAYTKNMLKYVERIALLMLISQPLYVVALNHQSGLMQSISFAQEPALNALRYYLATFHDMSILYSLLVGMIIIWSLRDRQFIVTLCGAIFVYYNHAQMDYGWRGIVLMVLFYLFAARPLLSLPAVGAFMVWWGLQGSGYEFMGMRFGIQMFAIFALPLIYIPTNTRLKLPKAVFYLFYPAHLALMIVAKVLF